MNLYSNFDSLSACFHNEKNLTNDYKCGDLEANETCGECGMINSAIPTNILTYIQLLMIFIFQNTKQLIMISSYQIRKNINLLWRAQEDGSLKPIELLLLMK